eukprot:TRINITY_DN13835_c0_g1_i1.p1 TRINITY_DN13835_c0_g1~~TRINITY_DN13835_c0_g1_i1.p1  ORF type:complete len:762 (+),score=72.95 TRINITY_DN13835_c0_g1_i1:310-2595(+)
MPSSHTVDCDAIPYDTPDSSSYSTHTDGYSSATETRNPRSGRKKSGRRVEFVPTIAGTDDVFLHRQVGVPGTLTWRTEFFASGGRISPLDDLPTFLAVQGVGDEFVHCVCTTPAGQWIQTEVADEPFHPLRVTSGMARCCTDEEAPFAPARNSRARQRSVSFEEGLKQAAAVAPPLDKSPLMSAMKQKRRIMLNDVLRVHPQESGRDAQSPQHYVDNAPWNLGFIPQTTTAQLTADIKRTGSARLVPETSDVDGASGPFEVVEIGAERQRSVGETYLVRPLGAFLVSNGGVLSWSVIAIADSDPMAKLLRSEADMRTWLPGSVEHIREWLRRCRCIHDGEHKAKILLMEKAADVDTTRLAIFRAHLAWQTRRRRTDAGASGAMNDAGTGLATNRTSLSTPALNPPRPPLPPPSEGTTASDSSDPQSLSPSPPPWAGSIPEQIRIPLSNPSSSTLFDSSWVLGGDESGSPVGAVSKVRSWKKEKKAAHKRTASSSDMESSEDEELRDRPAETANDRTVENAHLSEVDNDWEVRPDERAGGAKENSDSRREDAGEEDLLTAVGDAPNISNWRYQRSLSVKETRSNSFSRGSGASGRFNVKQVASLIPSMFRRGSHDKSESVIEGVDAKGFLIGRADEREYHTAPSSRTWSSRFGITAQNVMSAGKLGGEARFRKGEDRRSSRNHVAMFLHSAPEMSAEDKELSKLDFDDLMELPPTPRTVELEIACKKDAMRRLKSALNMVHARAEDEPDKGQAQGEDGEGNE